MSLDDFMRAMWRKYGKPGGSREGYVDRPYTIADAEATLAEVSGDRAFAREFFARYIQGHDVADYARLLARAGFTVRKRNAGTRLARRSAARVAQRRARRGAGGADVADLRVRPRSGRRAAADRWAARSTARATSRPPSRGTSRATPSQVVFVDRTGAARTGAGDARRGSAPRGRPRRARRHADGGAESVSRPLAGSEVMPLPWLQIIDAVVGVVQLRAQPEEPEAATEELQQQQQIEAAARTPGGLEARMAGVVVAALKEAFDRDTRRLELERDQLAAERERAERALRLELQRQAADREIGRLRLLAGVAVAGWLVTLLLAIWPGSRWSRPPAPAWRSAADGCSWAPRSPRRSARRHVSRRHWTPAAGSRSAPTMP